MSLSVEETAEAVRRAKEGQSMANYAAIFDGFEAKGIPIEAITPRENVFTYNVWKAMGRQVRKGEKGVRVVTFVQYEKNGETKRSPKTTTVFHITQTDEVSDNV